MTDPIVTLTRKFTLDIQRLLKLVVHEQLQIVSYFVHTKNSLSSPKSKAMERAAMWSDAYSGDLHTVFSRKARKRVLSR